MSDLRAAAQMALEALVYYADEAGDGVTSLGKFDAAIMALRAALAQEEQEPVTWGVDWGRDGDRPCCTIIKRHADGTQEVVAVEHGPPRREWQGLTDDEINRITDAQWAQGNHKPIYVAHRAYARAIEQACKERNT
jgi:hypothetical protein